MGFYLKWIASDRVTKIMGGFAKYRLSGSDILSYIPKEHPTTNKGHIPLRQLKISKWNSMCSFNGTTSRQSSQYMSLIEFLGNSHKPKKSNKTKAHQTVLFEHGTFC